MKYTIKQVSENPKEYETKFGKMKAYKIMLNDDQVVELNQKESTPAPTVGQELEGHIEEGEFGKKFKKEYSGFGSTGNTQVKFSNEEPGRQDSIIRQSSMKAAVDLVVGGQEKYEKLFDLAEEIVTWVKNEKTGTVGELYGATTTNPIEDKKEEDNFMDDEVDLDSIPF